MRGKIPTYSIGQRGDLPKIRVLIQEQMPTGGAKGGWISGGGHHILAYGYSKREILKAVLNGLDIERRGQMRGGRKMSLLTRIRRKIN